MNGDGDMEIAPATRDSEAALERARLAALAELRLSPAARPWQRQAWLTAAGAVSLTVFAALAVAVLSWPVPAPAPRLPGLMLLLAAQAAGVFAAMAPGRSRLVALSWLLTAGGVVAVLLGRALGGTAADTSSGWICSSTELLAGVAPLALVLAALRDGAWSWQRGVTAGVALGAAAFIWGEVACQRDLGHVLVHHGGAFVALALACVYLSRFLPPRHYAP